MERLGALGTGAAMGLLLGLMVGLSGSPVVGAVVAGLLTVLGAFFGLAAPGTKEPEREAPRARARDGARRGLTVAGFGLMGVVGVLLGVYLRAHGALSPSPRQRFERWRDAGFDSTRARALTEFELTGLVPDSGKVAAPQPAREGTSLLFSGDRARCERVSAEDLADAANMRSAFTAAGGEWREIAAAAAGLPEQAQRRVLVGAWRLACRVS
jgi:hypothetical protein